MEKAAGILKVPSVEFTLPRKNPDSSNGPHLNLYFRSLMHANHFYTLLRERFSRLFPGMAPVAERKDILETISYMRARDELALGIAHPYGETRIGKGMLRMGLINELYPSNPEGESLKFILEFVKKYADLVALFNPTFTNRPVSFPERFIPEAFFLDIISREVGTNASLTQSNITYAFSMHCRHELNKRNYFDHDTHVHSGVPFYWRMPSPLSYGRTVIHFTDWEEARDLFLSGDFSVPEFVQVLRRGSFTRNDSEIAAKVSFDAFIELEKGALRPVKPRRSPLRAMATLPAKIRQGIQYLQMLRAEAKRRRENMMN
jgi:hypothetical protein